MFNHPAEDIDVRRSSRSCLFFLAKDCGTLTPNVRPNQPGQVAIGLLRTNGGAAMRAVFFTVSFSIIPSRFLAISPSTFPAPSPLRFKVGVTSRNLENKGLSIRAEGPASRFVGGRQ